MMRDLPIDWELALLIFATILLVILVISFASRARVFCQYLRLMTGIKLTPPEVKKIYRLRGRAGVRELFLDLIIREDLTDSPRITPDTPPSRTAAMLLDDDRLADTEKRQNR